MDIVAHSMGGLAARNYASQDWYGLPPDPKLSTSLNGTTPFDGSGFGGRGFPGIPALGIPAFGTGRKAEQVTFGGDFIVKF